jgi:C1A family cysteine protease
MACSWRTALRAIAALLPALIVTPAAAGDGSDLEIRPPSAAFLEYQQRVQMGVPPVSGVIPSPIDRSSAVGMPMKGLRLLDALPASYDLRNFGRVSSVKDQLTCGACWAFATMGALEGSMLPGEQADFSENHLLNTSGFVPSRCEGGNEDMAAAYLMRWSGPVAEADDPFSATSFTSPLGLSPRKHQQTMYELPGRASFTSNDQIKQAVMQLGPIWTYIHWLDSAYNHARAAYYYSGTSYHNHSVLIVGWDDSYSRTNFVSTPPGDGAFLIKNSWGTSRDHEGYFYVSYYDVWAGRNLFYFPPGEPVTNYGSIYQHDPLGQTMTAGLGSESAWFANIFTAERDDELAAVGFYTTAPSSSYRVRVRKGVSAVPGVGALAADVSGTLVYGGYETIRIPAVPIARGERFSVEVFVNSPGTRWPMSIEAPVAGYAAPTSAVGQSFYSTDGATWRDLTTKYPNANACVKAYTRAPDATSLAVAPAAGAVGQALTLKATLANDTTHLPVVGAAVAFSVAGSAVASSETDAQGQATVNYIPMESLPLGESTITAAYAGAPLVQACSGTSMLAVSAAQTAMSSPDARVQAGSTLALAANLSRVTDAAPLPGRSIAFTLAGTPLGSATTDADGLASMAYSVPATAAGGTLAAHVSFAGDSHHLAGSADATVTIIPLKTPTVVTVPNRINITGGSLVPLGAFLTTTAGAAVGGGSIAFAVNGTAVGSKTTDKSGIALMYWTAPAGFAGANPIDAVYAGSAVYAAATGRGWINPGSTTVATRLTVQRATAAEGSTAALSATLAKQTDGTALAGKTVQFAVAGAAVGTAATGATGIAQLAYAVPSTGAATRAVTAAFTGNTSYAASTGASTLTVIGRPTATAQATGGLVGQPIAIRLAGADPQALPLTFATVTVPAHGALAGTAPDLTYTPQAGFTGEDSFTFAVSNGYLASLPATVKIVVGRLATITTVTGATGQVGEQVRFSSTTTDASGDAVAGAAVTFKTPDGAEHPAVTDATGGAELAWVIPGLCRGGAVTATFAGDAAREPSTGFANLTVHVTSHMVVSAASGSPGGHVAIDAYLREGIGATGVAGKVLELHMDGGAAIPFDAPTAASTGKATCSYTIPSTLSNGTHATTVSFAGDDDLPAAAGSSTLTVAGLKPTYSWLYVYKGLVGVSSKSVMYLYEIAGGGALLPLAGRTVRFSAAGTLLSTVTTAADGKGIYTYIPAAAGTFAAQTVFSGDASYTASSATGALTVVNP